MENLIFCAVYTHFKDNIWGANLTDLHLLSKCNKGFNFYYKSSMILLIMHGFLLWKKKRTLQLVMLFKICYMGLIANQKKIWIEKNGEFYNRWMKSWLQDNDTNMYLRHNEGKSVVPERFIRTLKNKIYKYMTYIDKLDKLVNTK